MHIIWSLTASADLNAIFEYLLPKNALAALETVEHIESSIQHLADHPEIGRGGRVTHTLELIVPRTPYIVAYRVRENVVEIASIIHASRKWPDRV